MDVRRLLGLAILCVLTSLVKYAFLPIFLGIIIYLGIRARSILGGWNEVWLKTKSGLRTASQPSLWLLSLALVLSCLLFVQRYGVNLALYHNPVPDCGSVLGNQACAEYGPWARDYGFEQAKMGTPNPVIFIGDWFYGMWFRLFFAVDGPTTGFQTRGPLLAPAVGSILFASSGLIAACVYARRILKRYDTAALYLLASTGLLYVAALWLDNLGAYMKTGQPVAINGRYLLPFLLPLILVCALSIKEFCRTRASWLKPAILTVAFACLVWGGGVLTYILRSNDSWYWPNATVRGVNDSIRRTIGPWTPGYRHPNEFMGRHGA